MNPPILQHPDLMRLDFLKSAMGISLLTLGLFFPGCNSPAPSNEKQDDVATSEETVTPPAEPAFMPEAYEADAETLLAARLPQEETAQGWVRLFDGQTLFGWGITGEANFHIEDDSIVVDTGAQSLMCTASTWGDFELELEFNADEKTNSGVFVRTPFDPDDPKTDCYEINIAPPDNPFPTGSIVGRQKATDEGIERYKPGTWQTMNIVADGREVTVKLDGETVCQYTDPVDLAARRIGLQKNSGRVQFRNIKIRPLKMASMLDPDLSQWKKYPDMSGDFTMNEKGELHVDGGKTQLETKESYGDFTLLAEYKIDEPNMNSGIFFRCIPGDEMMGYECQINNDFKDDSRLSPADCGTGGIFRRQDARIVAGENGSWSTVLLQAHGDKICSWVNGIQVSDWEDTRDPDENPRRGKRLEPGTIMIQGHDPETNVLFRNLQITQP